MPMAIQLAVTAATRVPEGDLDPMAVFLVLGGVVAALLLVYLVIAMLFPDKLQ